MKKGVLAVILLIVLLAAVLVNVSILEKMIGGLVSLIGESQQDALDGNWELAEKKAEEAGAEWKRMEPYIHIVVRYSEISGTSAAFYAYLSELYKCDAGGARGTGKFLLEQLESVHTIERVNFCTIF